jgi:hypothetical protein
MTWWIWLLVGLALLLIEIATPGVFFLFFGAAAIAVGVLTALGFEQAWLQLVVFSVLSIGSLLLFRGPLLRRMRPAADRPVVDAIAGETAVLTEDLPAHGIGRAELRGTVWTAENEGDEPLARGQRARVVRVQGLTLIVRREPRA